MAVYAVFEVELLTDPSPHDADGYERYRAAVPELIARFGGRYLVRAGTGTALEGRPTTGRWHLVVFPDAESAQQFWSCPEYSRSSRFAPAQQTSAPCWSSLRPVERGGVHLIACKLGANRKPAPLTRRATFGCETNIRSRGRRRRRRARGCR